MGAKSSTMRTYVCDQCKSPFKFDGPVPRETSISCTACADKNRASNQTHKLQCKNCKGVFYVIKGNSTSESFQALLEKDVYCDKTKGVGRLYKPERAVVMTIEQTLFSC